ncbi:ABA4-like family protein [Flavobacteriaceae bacterium KMM 6897]|nr:ABA4-like family protein [Flavobacteriaceae bacterium KMM 6897]MEB8345382.1 ABA4-like family protein [Flavobacteriaceae bacterium KMM 6898]
MTPTEVFSVANTTALPMWLLMIVLPKWKVTRFLIDFKVIPLALSLVYAFYIIQALQIGGWMDFGSLAAVMALFTEENALLAGWVHYLAFDLLVGMWILDENKKLGIHQLLLVPCLLGTFMFGPLGFLLFMIIRGIKGQQS